jgi:transcriptional regulator of acetoin/glycerol metabolism
MSSKPAVKTRAKSASPTSTAGHVLSERFADPDLVDRIFDYVLDLLPELAGREADIKTAIREEFGGEEQYVRSGQADQRAVRSRALAAEVLSLFNGRNATEVARSLRISRATVYRLLKQSGRAT